MKSNGIISDQLLGFITNLSHVFSFFNSEKNYLKYIMGGNQKNNY